MSKTGKAFNIGVLMNSTWEIYECSAFRELGQETGMVSGQKCSVQHPLLGFRVQEHISLFASVWLRLDGKEHRDSTNSLQPGHASRAETPLQSSGSPKFLLCFPFPETLKWQSVVTNGVRTQNQHTKVPAARHSASPKQACPFYFNLVGEARVGSYIYMASDKYHQHPFLDLNWPDSTVMKS